MNNIDAIFSDAISRNYETHLVPLIFEPYATNLAARLSAQRLTRVLELAAGTGVATRALARVLPASVEIVATDLNQAMLDQGAAVGTSRPVEWRRADAMSLPFEDGAFDAIVCQFGVMFFPDRAAAFAEAARVLRPGGTFMFSTWDRIEVNELAAEVTEALAGVFPEDPPRFLARTPHGYHDKTIIERDVRAGGFTQPVRFETVPARSPASSCDIPAIAYCHGTPLRTEIEARGSLDEATAVATDAIARRFGRGPIDAIIQAHIVTTER